MMLKKVFVALLAVSLAVAFLQPIPAQANHDPYCWAVGYPSVNNTLLTRITKSDANAATNEASIGATGTEKTDAIAFQPGTGVLFGVNSLAGARPENDRRGYVGTYNLSTGAFTAFANPIGFGDGRMGSLNIYDVSGLSFDPVTGYLYGSHVRTGSSTSADLLFRIDPATGRLVENAFGLNVDYVEMTPIPAFQALSDVDDIAFDPTDGTLYGIINNSTVGDRLVRVNKSTGALTDVGAFGIGEVEGMDFDPHGRLWVTAGVTDNSTAYYLYEVNKATGQASSPHRLDNTTNYEALGCLKPFAGLSLPYRVLLPETTR
jgi:hypothetical protein